MSKAVDYPKRIQSRLSRQGFSFTKDQIRGVYNAFVKDPENPTEEELAKVANQLKYQPKFASKATDSKPVTDDGAIVAASCEQTETIEITPENNPDIWETLQPPAEEPQPEVSNQLAIEGEREPDREPEHQNGIVKSEGIPQSEVKDLVSQTFASQPQEVREQITEYALQHSFENVRQVQEFLEQLRGMEFNLLAKTLQDHFNRRGSMMTLLNEVIQKQQQKDGESRQDFFQRVQPADAELPSRDGSETEQTGNIAVPDRVVLPVQKPMRSLSLFIPNWLVNGVGFIAGAWLIYSLLMSAINHLESSKPERWNRPLTHSNPLEK